MTNEEEIRTLIERWAGAAHSGDLEVLVEDHAAGIVMFDVPPPYDGVRGLDAYRESWPGFFEWQAAGATFEIESLEVTAGEGVAFAFALLTCGMPDDLEQNPAKRLRLTLGLRKENGRWVVSHEHHSFPIEHLAADSEVRELHDRWSEFTAAMDLDAMMDGIAEDVVSYEYGGPLQHVGKPAVREVCEAGLDSAGKVELEAPDLTVLAREDLAVTWGLAHVTTETADSWSRATRIFRRDADGWKMIHQHLSFPMGSAGESSIDLKP